MLQKRNICGRRSAIIACVVDTLLAATKNGHVFWTRDVDVLGNTLCGRPQPYRHFEQYIRPWLAFVSVCVIPALVLVVCNVAVVRQIIRLRRAAVAGDVGVTELTASRCAGNPRRAVEVHGRRSGGVQVGTFAQTSMMCVAASLTFLICVPPSVVLTVARVYWSHHPAYYVLRTVNNQLVSGSVRLDGQYCGN